MAADRTLFRDRSTGVDMTAGKTHPGGFYIGDKQFVLFQEICEETKAFSMYLLNFSNHMERSSDFRKSFLPCLFFEVLIHIVMLFEFIVLGVAEELYHILGKIDGVSTVYGYRLTGKFTEMFVENFSMFSFLIGGKIESAFDYDQSVWDYNTVNNESSRQRMTIMPADNKYSEYNEDGDLYPYNGNTSFTDDSRPAAKTNTGLKLGKPVTNIEQDNGVITFDFMGGTPAVVAPVADVATHVTTTGFTANWSSVENAVSYTLQVDRKQPSAGGEILLSEDFSNCTADETTNIAGTTTFGNAKDGYFQTSGWSGKYLFPNIGKMKLGNSDNGGAVCTPAIDLSSCDGVFTVQFDASMFDGSKEKSVVIKVYVEGDESNAQSTEILSTSKMNTYTMTFTGGTADSKIVLMSTASSGKKRAYLDNIVVYSGEVLPEMASKQAVSDVWPLIVTGITDTSYQLVDLEPGYVYSYKVKAVTAEGEESDYSNVVKVDLSTGICDLPESHNRVYTDNGYIVVECETSQPVEVVNLTGPDCRICIREWTFFVIGSG